MDDLLERIEDGPGGARLRARGTTVAEVIGRLEGGEAPADVAGTLGLDAADLVAVLAFVGLGPGEADGPALVQGAPPHPKLASAVGEAGLAPLLPRATRPAVLALSAGVAQVLDFWDASHDAAQRADDLGERDSSAYWHGIAHRREPDAGNASYWFRRVGRHPLFGPLGAAARDRLAAAGEPRQADRLAPGGRWDPFAMIELCSSARSGSPRADLARRLQRLEMRMLLARTAAKALGGMGG